MISTPGSFSWLVAHDIRLAWRGASGMLGSAGKGVVALIAIVGAVVLHAIAWPVARWLSPHLLAAEESFASLAIVALCVLGWLVAQSLFGAARMLYLRSDLDLLLGSPIAPHKVFAAKAAGVAVGSFGSIALLVLPIANAGALLVDPAWLGVYPALIGLTLISTALGLSLAIALFSMLEARHARLWTQLLGAATAGAFVLGVQIAAVLPAPMRSAIGRWVEAAARPEAGGFAVMLRLPIDAARGDLLAATLLVAIGAALLAAATLLLGKRFAETSVAAAGVSAGGDRRRRRPRKLRFRTGLTWNMRLKEWRLLVRDPGLFAQLSLQIIYTLPIAVILLRNENLPSIFALAPTIVVVAAQVSASLAWLTVSGEDAPELIATAPVTATAINRAKLDAVAVPVLAIIALPLAALSLVSVDAAMKTTLVAAAAGMSTALLNFWHPMPGNRRGMLRRHSQSKLIAILEHGIAMLWAGAVVLVLIGTVLAAVPVVLVVGILASFQQRCARMG